MTQAIARGGAKAVLLDLDGTVANSVERGLEAHNRFASICAKPFVPIKVLGLDVELLNSLRAGGYRKALKHLDINMLELMAIRRMTNQHMRRIAGEVPAFDGMPEFVNELSEIEGLKTGVVSSGAEGYVTGFLAAQSIYGLDVVHGGAGLLLKARAIKQALRIIATPPELAVYIGDEPRDVKAARRLGMVSIGVTWGVAGEEGFQHAEPDYYARSVPELSTTVHNLVAAKE